MKATKKPRILLLALHVFSITGGVEKVTRVLSKALFDLKLSGAIRGINVMSMYDSVVDERYLPSSKFDGFGGNKMKFGFSSIAKGANTEILILSHIHLLIFALLIKKINNKIKIIVYAHGIEVWGKLPKWKTNFIKKHCELWAVSNYTKNQLVQQQIPEENIKVVNNCLDPYFVVKNIYAKSEILLKRYNLTNDQPVLFTLTRMSYTEKYKGYDQVINILGLLLPRYPKLVYILSGQADKQERKRIENLVKSNNLTKNVILTGFINEEEKIDHYQLANIFVMPSKGEGFGISFIEAAACGIPSIAGNKDGSTDALLNGKLGDLIDPVDKVALEKSILSLLKNRKDTTLKDATHNECLFHFSYQRYCEKINAVLTTTSNTKN